MICDTEQVNMWYGKICLELYVNQKTDSSVKTTFQSIPKLLQLLFHVDAICYMLLMVHRSCEFCEYYPWLPYQHFDLSVNNKQFSPFWNFPLSLIFTLLSLSCIYNTRSLSMGLLGKSRVFQVIQYSFYLMSLITARFWIPGHNTHI